MLSSNIGVDERGRLTFAGMDTVALAEKYKTPLYLMDEDRIRANCRTYRGAMEKWFGAGSFPLYASKAASFKQIYRIMAQEGMAIDVVSSGEVYTAVHADFPMERAYFHGNNKTDEDIAYAMDCGLGCFVVDGFWELEAIERIAAAKGIVQNVLLRLTPGIDPHTYEAVATGKVDSKFGVAIETGQAARFVEQALAMKHLKVLGYHCHVGSMVFDEEGDVYQNAADIMLSFAAEMKAAHGLAPEQLNLGGGYGVRYTESDPHIDIEENIRLLSAYLKKRCTELGLAMPAILMEPGRSIVADAGMTLYSVGTVKKIPEYKNYVSVDGGMTDNPRYALYQSRYTVLLADRPEEKGTEKFDVVGRCCESGDIIQPAVPMPEPKRGEILAVCTTGAYNYSMASNYNRVARPPIVMLSGGRDYVAVRRESPADMAQNDL